MWDLNIRIIRNDLPNETLTIETNIGAIFHNLSFDVPILIDGLSQLALNLRLMGSH